MGAADEADAAARAGALSGGLARLLEALGRRLPAEAQPEDVAKALKAAAAALPPAKARLRSKIEAREEELVERLLASLASRAVVGDDDDLEDERSGDEGKTARESEEDQRGAGSYAGVDGEQDPAACLSRCSELLAAARASLRSAELASQAIEGLVAVLPAEASPEVAEFDVPMLRHCARLAPAAVAVLAEQDGRAADTPELRRFLGFLLAAPARAAVGEDASADNEAAELACRLGSLAALAAPGAAAARGALRAGLTTLARPTRAAVAARLAPALAPLVRLGFARAGGALAPADGMEEEPLCRGDLVALLHALRIVGLCRSKGGIDDKNGAAAAVAEARDDLVAALERRFDCTQMRVQLGSGLVARVPGKRGVGLRKRLAGSAGGSRAGLAAIIADALEAAPKSATTAAALGALADCVGLPRGEDEQADEKAAAARAKGDLFFEDVGGAGGGDGEGASDDSEAEAEDAGKAAATGMDPTAVAAAAKAARARAVESLEGLEALQKSAKRSFEAKSAAAPKGARRKRRKKVAEGEAADEAAE